MLADGGDLSSPRQPSGQSTCHRGPGGNGLGTGLPPDQGTVQVSAAQRGAARGEVDGCLSPWAAVTSTSAPGPCMQRPSGLGEGQKNSLPTGTATRTPLLATEGTKMKSLLPNLKETKRRERDYVGVLRQRVLEHSSWETTGKGLGCGTLRPGLGPGCQATVGTSARPVGRDTVSTQRATRALAELSQGTWTSYPVLCTLMH